METGRHDKRRPRRIAVPKRSAGNADQRHPAPTPRGRTCIWRRGSRQTACTGRARAQDWATHPLRHGRHGPDVPPSPGASRKPADGGRAMRMPDPRLPRRRSTDRQSVPAGNRRKHRTQAASPCRKPHVAASIRLAAMPVRDAAPKAMARKDVPVMPRPDALRGAFDGPRADGSRKLPRPGQARRTFARAAGSQAARAHPSRTASSTPGRASSLPSSIDSWP